MYQSALFRFTLPGLGGRKPSGARLTSKEITASLKTLASISISPDIEEHLKEAQKETFVLLNTPKKRQRQPRYYLNQFIDWGIKNDFFPSATLAEEESDYAFYPEKINCIKTTNRKKNDKFTFSFDVDDYAAEPLPVEQIQQHLQRINQEFISFSKHQTIIQSNREPTAENYEKYLKLILGWLYLEKGFSLVEISLSKLVPFIQLDFQIKEFEFEENPWLSQIIAKAKSLENIKDEAKRLVKLMRELFGWLKHPPSISTKRFYIKALIAYSKYVYRDETDETMALNFEDIPIVNRLRVFHKEVNSGKKKSSNPNNKYLPWSDVLDVIEKLRFEANLETKKHTDRRRKRSNRRVKRSLSGRAKSLQNFVLLGFFVLIPPSRQRVIRELELGRTLKYGFFSNGQFTPFKKMANPSEAKYYIHLQPEDYKTGDIYGEWLGEFPNTEFHDGSKFYDYLNRWLFRGYQDKNGDWHGMREMIAAPGEKTVLVRPNLGIFNDDSSMCQTINYIFTRWTGVSISPHDLRHLYRTYIDDPATGATAEEKESAAFWMRHSSQMAKKVYSHLDCEQKLRLGGQMSERLNQQLLNGRK
ncbi:hypothetical protein NDI49_24115 [Trichocoleus sp. ST-U3]